MVYSSNTITMLQDALIKCLEGKTSFEEVYRTIEIENEDDDNYENEVNNEIKPNAPQEEVQADPNDLLEITNNVTSDVVVPTSFTVNDFVDAPETTPVQQPVQQTQTTQPVQVQQPVQQQQPVQIPQIVTQQPVQQTQTTQPVQLPTN